MARTKVLGCGTIRDKAGLSGTKPRCLLWFWGGAAARWGSRLLSRGFPPFGDSRGGLGTVLTPGKACLKGLAAITTNTTQATIQAQIKPSSSWWRCSEPSRSASSAVGAVFANVQTPRCSRSARRCASARTKVLNTVGPRRLAKPQQTPECVPHPSLPDSHDGGDFFVDLTFSEGPDVGYRDVQKAVKVSGGSINRANRKTKGSNVGWKLKVRPAGTCSLTITLPATTNCSARGAICTTDDRRLTNSPSATVPGTAEVVETTPTVSIAGGSGTEGDDDDIDFTVTLDEAASGTVTVNYATSDGSAEAGDDYTAKSGTLSFSAGETSKTISVAIEDDSENESDETFTVTLSSASGADLGTKTATGTIRNRYVAPLTASFSNVPAEHDGTAFTFGPGLQREREDRLRSRPRRCLHRLRRHHREGQAEDPGQQPELEKWTPDRGQCPK